MAASSIGRLVLGSSVNGPATVHLWRVLINERKTPRKNLPRGVGFHSV